MNRILLFVLGTLLSLVASSQTVPVTVKITNQKGEPVSLATVTLVPAADTMAKQNFLSDSIGEVRADLQQNSLYSIRISSIEYASLEKNIAVKPGATLFRFVLQPVSKSLNNIVVTAKKPLMRQEDDKTIVDPEPIANTSTNAYEIMEKTPGLFVDQDGNIYISSTTPAKVFINGREQRMSASDIATILKSLPPNAISSIEILRMPSAKYDASGSGGIVNVVLRKGIRIGLTGSMHIGANQGRYGNQFMGINLNNSSGKLSSYLNLQVSKRNSFDELVTNRRFAPDSLLRQDAVTKYPANSYYLGYGINYALNDKWEWSYDGRLSYNLNKSNSENESVKQQLSTGQVSTQNIASVQNRAKNFSVNQGLNLKYKMDSAGSTWTTDLSYTYSPTNTDQLFATRFQLPVIFTANGDARIENQYHFASASTDLSKKLAHKITVEAGLKSTGIQFRNGNNYYNQQNGARVKDAFRTGAYDYNENINAAYLQVSKSFGGIVLKAGSRLENTNMSGHQLVPRDTSFSLHRTDLFPYVYLSRNIMKIAGYDLRAFLVYRRTISRPAYEYLNPSPRYVDPYLYETGNPSLRPQFTQTYEANISVDERPIIAIGVNDTKDIFNQVVYQADSNRSQAFRTYDNLGKNKETYIRALGALPPGGKYFFVLGGQYNHNFYQGAYENKPLSFKRGSWRFFTYHNFKATPTTNIFLNGFLMTNGQLQFYELSNFGQLNIGFSQQFFNKKLTMNVFGQDLFYTNKNEFVLNQGSVNATGMRRSDTRRLGIFLRYNFGIRKKEEQKLPDVDAAQRP
ncbi:outer membrane beta-barrel protein [Flavisolibacter nicotianae]|uniref:outer membrane beta-barrel protein n=1 Tax=Flavisolibacter nicotianae TaxID=2364882 RepID=UPI000EADBD27|nr:outer membrane beta-barrel protein [Flavisolibacter nicotianae]